MEWLGKIFEFLKMPLRIIAFVAFLSGFLLFLPGELIKTLILDEFINSYGQYFGISFLISVTFLIFTLVPLGFKWIKQKILNKRNEAKFLAKIEQTLSDLSHPEKCLLREFVLQNKHVIEVPLENPEVVSLLNKGVIQFASTNIRSFIYGNYIFIKINEKAKNFFTNETFGLHDRQPTPADMVLVKEERPDFLTRLEDINNLINGKWH